MIAVALGLLGLVVMVATGVVASSDGEDRLTFLGVGVRTTTAQVFVTGAILGWVLVVALWLLRLGVQRSGARCAELAGRRAATRGFGELDEEGWPETSEEPVASGVGRWVRRGRARARRGGAFGRADVTGDRSGQGRVADDVGAGMGRRVGCRIVGFRGAGAAGDLGVAPGRGDGGPHLADVAVAPAAEQARALGVGGALGPGAWGFFGIGVDRGGQGREVGGGSGAVPGENRRAEGEDRRRERRQ